VPPCASHAPRATAMWRWHDVRFPRNNARRASAGNDSAERRAGSFLNPQNFAITIGKPSPPVLTTANASSTYVLTRAGMPTQRMVREAT
jgi:hypothetical protein